MGVAPIAGVLLLLRSGLVTMYACEDGRAEEEEAVHDPKGEACLEHAARLVHIDIRRIDLGAPKDAKAYINRRAPCNIDAVDVPDEAQVVNARDKGTDETEIDKRNEQRIGRTSVVREQREDCPGEAENRDDKQDQDVVRGEKVSFDVAVDKVGQHAHRWDLRTMRR